MRNLLILYVCAIAVMLFTFSSVAGAEEYQQMEPCDEFGHNCNGYGQQLWTNGSYEVWMFDDSYIIEKDNQMYTKFDCVPDEDTTNLVYWICEDLLNTNFRDGWSE